MKEWYKTTMNIHFHTENDAREFVHQLDKAEELGRPNDFGPSWLGNLLYLMQVNPDDVAHNGFITDVEQTGSDVVVTFESGRGVHKEPITKLIDTIDVTANYTMSKILTEKGV